ncbi:MAG: shikimate dehydrogenase [Bacteroidaceae bacterium]|nr:shikimate dehydrogenase [Bacteroidaceae bacterium]
MKTFGLIGHPLGHSFSRQFFTEKFEREGIDAEYLNFDLADIQQLQQVMDEHPHLCGFNVTIPYKQQVMPFLDELSDEAREIGAVNVVRVCRDSGEPKLKGFNSDIIGFMDSIRPLLQPHHRRALVLGTGGASKAICVGLLRLGLEWRYVSRTAREGHFTYADITPELLNDYTVIVNCSPLGMSPRIDSFPELPYRVLTDRHLLYDLVYNPQETLFMRMGRRQGAAVKNGLEMLHLQAIASWNFWNETVS